MLSFSVACIGQQKSSSAEPTADERQQAQEFFQEADARMTGFYLEPTQEKMDQLAKLFSDNSKFASPRSQAGLLSSVVMGLASKKFDLKINQQGPLFDAANAIANDDTNHPLVKLLNDNSKAGEIRIKAWWYSYYATGDTSYVTHLQKLTGDFMAKDFKGQRRLSMLANGDFMRVAHSDDKLAKFCKEAAKKEKDAWRKSLYNSCVAWNKFFPDDYNQFDRSTPEGTLRLFMLGVMSNNEDLMRVCVYPIADNEFEYLKTDSKSMGTADFKSIVAKLKYKRLKAGDHWTTASGKQIEIPKEFCLLYTSPSPRDQRGSRMPSSA